MRDTPRNAVTRARQLSGAKFRRQHPIGRYVADFCCPAAQLIVELDGGHHAEASGEDAQRTQYLQARGFRVLRFWNHEVLRSVEAVLASIAAALTSAMPVKE